MIDEVSELQCDMASASVLPFNRILLAVYFHSAHMYIPSSFKVLIRRTRLQLRPRTYQQQY